VPKHPLDCLDVRADADGEADRCVMQVVRSDARNRPRQRRLVASPRRSGQPVVGDWPTHRRCQNLPFVDVVRDARPCSLPKAEAGVA
jgi:hypothetical protein